jgi:hypothetical protein
VIVSATLASITVSLSLTHLQAADLINKPKGLINTSTGDEAPIATSGDKNVYVAWPSNKTGNSEVMFKDSTDGGKTFSDKMSLSNSTKSESANVQISASGSNVYVSWWERNQTSNEPVLRVSNDNGKTFGGKDNAIC